MLILLQRYLNAKLGSTSRRTRGIVKNVVFSFGFKACTVAITFVLVPYTIQYMDAYKYGIWISITSLVSWMSFFDFGLANGLRNKLTTSLAEEDYAMARKYVSTTYISLGVCVIIFVLIFLSFNFRINWSELLNFPLKMAQEIQLVVGIAFTMFGLQFVLQILNTVFLATHKARLLNLVAFTAQLAVLMSVVGLGQTGYRSLITFSAVFMGVPNLLLIAASIYFYKNELNVVRPSFRHFDKNLLRPLYSVGLSYFLIQLGALTLFQSTNLIIARYLGATDVTEYNIAYKLFSVVTICFSLIIAPFWSAFSEAAAVGDFNWLRANVKRIRILWVAVSLVIVPLLFMCSSWIYRFWIGTEVDIPYRVSLGVAIYSILYMGVMVNSYFLNGVNKIQVQTVCYIAVSIVNIPFSIYLVKDYGVFGVLISGILLMTLMVVVFWFQVEHYLTASKNKI